MLSKVFVINYRGRRIKLQYLSDNDIAAREGGSMGRFQELPLLERLRGMAKGGTYVDVGANIGNHTIFFAGFTMANRVVAVEPHPVIAAQLRRNINSNSLETPIQVLEIAAWDDDCKLAMDHPVPGNSGRTSLMSPRRIAHDVRGQTLDAALQGCDDISIMKFDVEDSEAYALEGSIEIIEKQRPVLVTEAHTDSQLAHQAGFLGQFGYTKTDSFEPRGETHLWQPFS